MLNSIAYNNAYSIIEIALEELNDWSMEEYGVWSQTPYYLQDIVDILKEKSKNATLGNDNTIIVNGVVVYMWSNGYENKEKTYGVWNPIPYDELNDEYK